MGLSVHSLGRWPVDFRPGSSGAGVSAARTLAARAAGPWIPHRTASRGAVAGNRGRGRSGEVNLEHNGVLVIDRPTEFDRDTADALVAVAEDIYRHTPVDHTIRMPACFRLMVTTRPDELDTRRHRAEDLLQTMCGASDPAAVTWCATGFGLVRPRQHPRLSDRPVLPPIPRGLAELRRSLPEVSPDEYHGGHVGAWNDVLHRTRAAVDAPNVDVAARLALSYHIDSRSTPPPSASRRDILSDSSR